MTLKVVFVNDCRSSCEGMVGQPTPYTDINGQQIHVGDFVELYDSLTHEKTWEDYVCYCKNRADDKKHGDYLFTLFGMGHHTQETGAFTRNHEYAVIAKSHTQAKHGDRHGLLHLLAAKDSELIQLPRTGTEDQFTTLLHQDSQTFKGYVGLPIRFSDCYGRKLFAGDVVQVFDLENTLLHTGYVGFEEVADRYGAASPQIKSMILGFDSNTYYKHAFDCKKHRIELVRGYAEIQLGQGLHGFVAIPSKDLRDAKSL